MLVMASVDKFACIIDATKLTLQSNGNGQQMKFRGFLAFFHKE